MTNADVDSTDDQRRRAHAIYDPSQPGLRPGLDAAIVAFTARGRRKTPASDAEAVLALDPANGAELLRTVQDAVRVSDAIPFEEVAPFDTGLRERLYQSIHDRLPHLGPSAIDALGWRWGFLQFS